MGSLVRMMWHLRYAMKAGASAAPHEEKKVAPPKPDVRANLKRAKKAAKTLMTAVHKQAEAAKKEVKRARAAKSATDDEWDRFLDETLEGAVRRRRLRREILWACLRTCLKANTPKPLKMSSMKKTHTTVLSSGFN